MNNKIKAYKKNKLEVRIDTSTQSNKWWDIRPYENFEPETFKVFDYFLKKDGVCIDLGAWIGPTCLYAAQLSKRVFALEPDPVAFKDLKRNIKANNFKNIKLLPYAISPINGKYKIGGNGELGNSQSSILDEVQNEESVEIKGISFEYLLKSHHINPRNIDLIKIDIEGGEKLLISSMDSFLRKNRTTMLLSLHFSKLEENEIRKILDILFSIYFVILDTDFKTRSIDEIIENKISSVVCL